MTEITAVVPRFYAYEKAEVMQFTFDCVIIQDLSVNYERDKYRNK